MMWPIPLKVNLASYVGIFPLIAAMVDSQCQSPGRRATAESAAALQSVLCSDISLFMTPVLG